MSTKSHYDEKYFDWQSKIGKFGGLANKIKFRNFIKKGKKVLDFGCGGGYLLSSFDNIENMELRLTKLREKPQQVIISKFILAQMNCQKIFLTR